MDARLSAFDRIRIQVGNIIVKRGRAPLYLGVGTELYEDLMRENNINTENPPAQIDVAIDGVTVEVFIQPTGKI